jgi:diguanylate cyclase (GGDEF)-like protein
LVLGLVVTVSLSRNLLPRIRQYSTFATDVAADRLTAPLVPRSHDELTVLGSALNDMVDQRATASLEQRRQTEFVETLQVTDSEEEAHLLIQRHLARSIEAHEVLVLKRNNSANRLEAATDLATTSALAERLVRLDPSACLALRLGRGHQEGGAEESLLSCRLCGQRGQLSTCEPLMVSGEVIGSVLVTHDHPIDADARSKIRNTVAQAAPMLANLRNLALAEFRANNDPLTGLPNKRATEDTLKRMVAQANRSIAPFSAVMLDLDHFKQINDRFGHALGDDVLAAVGAAIRSCLRDSDFGGRFGGEEFLVLLPETDTAGALLVAEKIRTTIAALRVAGVDREITASLGVAGLLEHAGSSLGLLRAADQAQYAAKAAGRNQAKVASSEPVSPDAESPAPPSAPIPSPEARH